MSTSQRLTLIGLYNYDSTLFDNLTLPTGYDKDTFINALLLEHGEKCVLYTNPTFYKNAVGIWSSKWELELTRIYESLIAEYNPLYNYDRYEELKDVNKLDRTVTNKPDYSDTQTNDYDIVNEQNTDATSENKISADNSSDYQPDNKNISNSGKNTTSNDGTIKHEIKGTSENIEEGSKNVYKHNAHIYGNIGVTTSSAMIKEVLSMRQQNNLYDIATRIFASELLLGIY